MLAFGPDGYLYIGMGDGGGAGDPGNRAQSTEHAARQDPADRRQRHVGPRHYRIPASNPYVGKAGLDEIWSRGLRNPWRFSFDRLTGDLWIGDVGQDRYEEVDRSSPVGGEPAAAALNYGWRVMEGRALLQARRPGCTTAGKTLPVVEYPHSQGCCRSPAATSTAGRPSPALVGPLRLRRLLLGRIWTIPTRRRPDADDRLLMRRRAAFSISSFGEDEAGELYVVDLDGTIYKFATAS